MDRRTDQSASHRARIELRDPRQRTFVHLLLNTVAVAVMNSTVWFALTFWAYLETQSVFATGMIAGIFLVAIALTGIWFGSLVDHHHKKRVMQASAAVSFGSYATAVSLYLLTPDATFRDPASPLLWVFIVVVMLGVITGNLRLVALPSLVTLLIPADRRDKANGLVGTATGVSFLVTSGRAHHRSVVRDRSRPGHRPGLRRHRHRRPGGDAARPGQPPLPGAEPGPRQHRPGRRGRQGRQGRQGRRGDNRHGSVVTKGPGGSGPSRRSWTT